MPALWFYTPQGEAAVYQDGDYIYKADGGECLYWETNGWWCATDNSNVALYKQGEWIYDSDGNPKYYHN